MLRVLVLSELLYPHGSGAELATSLWIKLLAKSGFTVKVITNRFEGESKRSQSANVEIERLPLLDGKSMKYSLMTRVGTLLSSHVRNAIAWADVVYVPRFWYTAIVLAKVYRKRVVAHLHDYIPICSLANFYDLSSNTVCTSCTFCKLSCIVSYEKAHGRSVGDTLRSALLNFCVWRLVGRLVQLSDAVVCVSKAQRDIIVRRMPSLARKCHLIYNPPPSIPLTEPAGRDIGYFGGPNPVKGYDVLRAALGLARSTVTVHATGFERRHASEVAGESRIVFHSRLPNSQYEQLYAKIRTVVVPSVWAEPLSYVVAEAALMGRLVLASRIGGMPELADGCPGVFLFRPGHYKELASLIERTDRLDDRTVTELGRKNRQVILKRLDIDRISAEFKHLLEETAKTTGIAETDRA